MWSAENEINLPSMSNILNKAESNALKEFESFHEEGNEVLSLEREREKVYCTGRDSKHFQFFV